MKITRTLKEINNRDDIIAENEIRLIKGNSNILFTAPHSADHVRNGKTKVCENGIKAIVKLLKHYTNVNIIYLDENVNYDPNYDKNNEFTNFVCNFIKENNIKYLIDLHGLSKNANHLIEIGTNNFENINSYHTNNIKNLFYKNGILKVLVDKNFKSSTNTVSTTINKLTGITTMQLELSYKLRKINKNKDNFYKLMNSLLSIIEYFEVTDETGNYNYIDNLNNLLNINALFNKYTEKYIPHNELSLELSLNISYEGLENISTMTILNNIKNIIKNNGHFIKEFKSPKHYNFRIVINPNGIKNQVNIYKKILNELSSNESFDMSAFTMNLVFNKKDLLNIYDVHEELNDFISKSEENFFSSNVLDLCFEKLSYKNYLKKIKNLSSENIIIDYLDKNIFRITNIRLIEDETKLEETMNTLFRLMDYKEIIDKKEKLDIEKFKGIKAEHTREKTIKVITDLYDKVLKIKPAYGYKRDLGVVNYSQVGLEIEVAVHIDRDRYSFIKKLLKQIKLLVGDNGYFTKDNTVLSDYNFEIVLDPLYPKEIYNFYSDLMNIVEFSNGSIEISKECNCGIHFNFNKNDVTDLSEAHKKLITLFIEKGEKYFDENVYKQFKCIWDFKEYYNFQNKISAKYVWLNYLKTYVIEIRNIKSSLSAMEIYRIVNETLGCLYYDKKVKKSKISNQKILTKIYDTALNNKDNHECIRSLNKNEFMVLSIKDDKAKLVKLPKDLVKKIKEYL